MVAVKDVPDVQLTQNIVAGRLVREKTHNTLNELDENALQAATDLRDQHGGEIVAVSIGLPHAADSLRRALQMGADHAILVTDERLTGLDAMGTAAVLAAVVKWVGDVDLVLAGMVAADGQTGLVPPAVAARLGWVAVTGVEEMVLTGRDLHVTRVCGVTTATVKTSLPAVISVSDSLNQPQTPGFKAIFAARKKPLTKMSLADLAQVLPLVGVPADGPVVKVKVTQAQQHPGPVDQVIVNDDGHAGTDLATWLIDRDLI